MKTLHVAWPSIGLLHYTIDTVRHLARISGMDPPRLFYRSKVKQHGTNCAVQVWREEGVPRFCAQGRTDLLTPEDDFKGFAKWVEKNEAYFAWGTPERVTIFGEWCGPGVEPGMAVSGLPGKIFAVFALQVGDGEGAEIVFEPDEINHRIGPARACPDLHVLPWSEHSAILAFSSDESLAAAAEEASAAVLRIEQEDPWVKRTFGVSGLGEGLVFYPSLGKVPSDPSGYCSYMWKAKGDKHQATRVRAPAQVAPEVAAGIEGFVDMVVTQARLEQGLSAACGGVRDPKLTSKFFSWVEADVQKESPLELAASGLTWDQVKRAVQKRAVAWYLNK